MKEKILNGKAVKSNVLSAISLAKYFGNSSPNNSSRKEEINKILN